MTMINVKDRGALGNGVADDLVAINLAITDAIAGGTGIIFPEGKYPISAPLSITTGILISGYGASSILSPSGNQAFNVSSANVTIKDLAIDSSSAFDNCTNLTIKNCAIANCPSDGIQLTNCDGVFIQDCTFNNCSLAAISLATSSDHNRNITIIGNRFDNIQTANTGGNGCIQARANSGTTKNDRNVKIIGNYLTNIVRVGMGMDGCDEILIDGNTIEKYGTEGIAVTGRDVTITNNKITHEPTGNAGACIILWSDDGSDGHFNEDIVIVGNILTSQTSSAGQCIAIVPNGMDHVIKMVVVQGNILRRAQNGLQGYNGAGVGGTYGLDGLFYSNNVCVDCGSTHNIPPWPVKNITTAPNMSQ